MRRILLCLILLVLTGCPKQQAGADGDENEGVAASANSTLSQKLVIICSATESDQWTRDLLNLAGGQMGFDPWAAPSTSGHLDIYGPYETKWDGRRLEVVIALAGLNTVADMLAQQTLGADAREWLGTQNPDVVWLDGDPVQLHIGMHLVDGPPILFTGVVNDQDLYYGTGYRVTGVYQRHNLAGVLGQAWQLDPERFEDPQQPRMYALVTDDSPISQSRAARWAKLESALPAEHAWMATPAAHSWADLHQIIDDAQDKADALIFCGVGEEGCSQEFLDTPPPADLLEGNHLPAVVLGPSRMDQCGAVVMTVKPSAVVTEALDRLGKLLDGKEAASLGMVEPAEMGLYLADNSAAPVEQTVADDEAAATEESAPAEK